jgi:type I protein arginine methyltransferase
MMMSSQSAIYDDNDAFDDWDDEEEAFDGGDAFQSLMDESRFTSMAALLRHDHEVYGFDVIQALSSDHLRKDYVSLIRLVNFIRRRRVECLSRVSAAAGRGSEVSREDAQMILDEVMSHKHLEDDDRNMIPVLADDAILLDPRKHLLNLSEDEDDDEDVPSAQNPAIDLATELAQYKSLVQRLLTDDGTASAETDPSMKEKSSYFAGYGHITIHETMLRDEARTNAYAFALSSDFIRDKTVLDVGCGSGILSLFAARAGAKQVIGIDNSDILDLAEKIVHRNGYSHSIKLVRGSIEDCSLPLEEDQKVDVVVSEW